MSDEPRERRGLWGLFRSTSSANGDRKLSKDRRRVSEADIVRRGSPSQRHRDPEVPIRSRGNPNSASAGAVTSTRRRPRRPDPSTTKGKGREVSYGVGGRGSYEDGGGPLTEWPPSGMSSSEELTLGHAMELISRGVPAFKGHRRSIPHASDHYYALYATAAGNGGEETDVADAHDAMVQLMTMRLHGSGPILYPWETMEQPSMAFCFGARPGTITLNHWISMASVLPPSIPLRDPGVAPRHIRLEDVLTRLKQLERGLEEDDEELMYKNLYKRLLKDPEKVLSPHKTLDKQITDLILVLSRSDWFDFTNPRNQIVTRFIFDTSLSQHDIYLKFFHQLLLSVELAARIHSKNHLPEAKEKLLRQIPPTIQYDLALARRWRENVRIDTVGETAEQVRLRFKLRKRQVKMLKRFAQMMKWPNLEETLKVLHDRDEDSTLDLVSSHAMAFFSGLVLPGPTFPFLMMNALVDLDPDKATDDLALLTHLHPHCGFQYRNSYTYWTAESIVGKVLAPTCHAVGGWIGPARPTPDLGRSQIARIRSRRPIRPPPLPEDVASMRERSDPLGPPSQVFPVQEYKLATPETDDLDGPDAGLDLVRTELLTLAPCKDRAREPGPKWFDAGLQFAIDGVSWPLRLAFNVSFVSAWPCTDGPHPLFFDYTYQSVRADELVHVRDWNGLYSKGAGDSVANMRSARSSPGVPTAPAAAGAGSSRANGNGKGVAFAQPPVSGAATNSSFGEDDEKVLVVEAFGVPDNEVLARAWCAHWGLGAVAADIGTTCMSCAIREAYAATLTVVILVDGSQGSDRDD